MVRDQFDCIVCFVDNTAAEHALHNLTSKNPSLCWLIGAFWVWVARQGVFVNFQRVTSQANLSDKVSRGDFSEAQQLGCSRSEPQFDAAWRPLFRLQEAPASLQSWDFQAVVDSLFAEPPHSEGGEWRTVSGLFVRAVENGSVCSKPVRSKTERQHSRAGRGEKRESRSPARSQAC